MSAISIIHPSQIDIANAAFTPAKEDIAYAPRGAESLRRSARARRRRHRLPRPIAGLSDRRPRPPDHGAGEILGVDTE